MISLTPKNASGPAQPFKLAPVQAETSAGEVL
jgi:hypothetical protein